MATSPKFRLKQMPTDVWSIRERLCLASSVLRSGDQNWVSVSRAIKSSRGETNRPPDWFSQKNCAIQYSDLLEKVETPKRKRGDRGDVETPGNLIVRKLTIERIEELKRIINEEQQRHKKLKQEIDAVKSGCLDDKLDEIWNKIQEEIKLKEIAEASYQKWLQEREAKINALKAAPKPLGKTKKLFPKHTRVEDMRRHSSQSEQSEQDSIVDSPLSEPLSVEYFTQLEDASSPQSTVSHLENVSIPTKVTLPGVTVPNPITSHGSQTPSTSPLLTSLLKSPTPTTPISPSVSSVLASPTHQPKEGTLPTTQANPRPTSTPQPFFNPSSALATAAARQLAVATAPSSNIQSIDSLFSKDKLQCSNLNVNMEGHIQPVHSATSSAPTLSKLLELPPGIPGKLPPLPIIQPEQNISTIQSSTVSTLTTVTSSFSALSDVTNVISGLNAEIMFTESSEDFVTESSDFATEDSEQVLDAKNDISSSKIEIKTEPPEENEDYNENAEENKISQFSASAIETTEIKQESNIDDSSTNETANEEKEIEEAVLEESSSQNDTPNVEEAKESPAEIHHKSTEKEIVELDTIKLVEVKKERIEEIADFDKLLESSDTNDQVLPENSADESKDDANEELVEVTQSDKGEITNENNTIDKGDIDKSQVLETENESVEEKKNIKVDNINEKEDIISEPESSKLIDDVKIVRKSSKKGRKGRPGRFSKQLNQDESESSKDKKEADDSSVSSSLTDKDITSNQLINDDNKEKQEKHNETQSLDLESISQQQQIDGNVEQLVMDSKHRPLLSVSESIPNSPASISHSDDQEHMKDYRTWKKAIMLVWNAAANHKYANTFLHPVTDDVAPGYHSIVFRPMDLSAIKKNIENGSIKTTIEFQRDMMLMFQNAVMYNSSDHDVFHMAVEMQKEVMEHIQDFLATQLMVQTAETKVLRGRERESRERKSEGDKDDSKRKHTITPEGEPKAKKRRIRDT